MAYLHLIILLLVGLVASDQVTTIGGVAQFFGTTIVTPPVAIPTLIYNCVKMPAICKNVGKKYAMDPTTKQLLTDPQVFHYDPNTKRTGKRQEKACGIKGEWYDTHKCPEPDQPSVVPVDGGYVSNQGSKRGNAFGWIHIDDVLQSGGASNNMIGDKATGNYRALFWSCDEFPAASWVEGGADANSYCVPMDHNCGDLGKKYYKGYAIERSEQNWQSDAHSGLSSVLPRGRPGIFVFHFRTMHIAVGAGGDIWAAKLVRYRRTQKLDGMTTAYYPKTTKSKRAEDDIDITDLEEVTHYYFSNGSTHIKRQPYKRQLDLVPTATLPLNGTFFPQASEPGTTLTTITAVPIAARQDSSTDWLWEDDDNVAEVRNSCEERCFNPDNS